MTSCPICTRAPARALPGTALVLCGRCGFVYRAERPSMAEAAAGLVVPADGRHYTEVIDLAASGTTMKARATALAEWTHGRLPVRPLLLELGSMDTTVLAPLRPLWPEGGRLRGADIADVARAGAAAVVSEWTCDGWVRRPLADDVGTHDVVVMDYTLHRLPDFVAALGIARSALKLGGVLYLECANVMQPHPAKRLKKWLNAQHFACFSMARLEDILARAGFVIERRQEDTSLRVLGRVSEPVRGAWRGESDVARVVGALVLHEVKYWPPYVAKRVLALAGMRGAA